MVFWIEASQQIGMGHLMESLVLAEYFISQNTSVHFIINPYEPSRLELKKRGINFVEYEIDKIDDVIRFVKQKDIQCVLVNHRNVAFNTLEKINHENFAIVVIDQLGNKPIICDLLINQSLVPEWLKYDFPKNQPLCCFGADYAILGESYKKLHRENKTFSKNRYTILVSMGGVDRTGATFRVIKALRPIKNISKEIIIGNGFAHMKQLTQLREKNDDSSFIFSIGVDDLHERISNADIVISAGGNTVYELACIGTPGIILWEDQHEYIQGKAFAEKGVLRCLGNGISTPIETISNSIKALLQDIDSRKHMSQCGRKTVDGRGKDRVSTKITELNQRRVKK